MSNRVNEADGGTEGTVKVVQPRGEDEFLQQATKARLLSVEEDHLKVNQIGRRDADFRGNELDEVGMMAFRHRLQRSETLLLCVIFSSAGSVFGAASAVKFRSNEASDGEELGLLVECESLLAFKMDCQGWDTENCGNVRSAYRVYSSGDILGRSILTSFCTIEPSLVRTITLPATPRSRSNPLQK